MNVTLRQLRAFVTVAQLGNFTRAAASLHITQSTLSGLVRELEAALGVQLVQRTTRKVELSEVGRQLLPLIARIIQDLDDALLAVSDLKALKSGTVRIAAPQMMACTLLTEVTGAFMRKHPGIDVRLVDSIVDDVQRKVQMGEVDFGVSPERTVSPELTAMELFDMPFVAVLSADHPLTRYRSLSWGQLLTYPLISLQGEYTHMLRRELQAARQALNFAPKTEVTFVSTALSMVSAGVGVTVCMPYARSMIDLYGLQTRSLGQPIVRRKFYLLARHDRVLSPAARTFAEDFLASVAQHKWGDMNA